LQQKYGDAFDWPVCQSGGPVKDHGRHRFGKLMHLSLSFFFAADKSMMVYNMEKITAL
jgi:hypothetical protein